MIAVVAPPAELTSEEVAPARPRHRPQPRPRRRRGLHRRVGWLGPGPTTAMIIHVVAALTLMPVAGHPYDLASLTGTSEAWLRWGVPLFYNWKFGADLSVLAVGGQSLAFVLQHLGMSGAAAVATGWKLPLVLADLLVGVALVDLGRQLRSPRPGLIATLWLISPVPLWVSAGHGQIESLTILGVVLGLDLVIRRRPLLAGVVVGFGVGVEYLPALVALIVVFWFFLSVVDRRELLRFAVGGAGALAFCFGPSLATVLGRRSLLGGLSFTASVASHPGHTQAASIGSSLWAIFDLSPGSLWLFVALSAAAALLVVLARRSKSADRIVRERMGALAAGGLLLCVTILDPGALPQFSVLVLAGLCLIGLSLDLSPAVIIIGPALQLAAGFFFVYGGSFQSFWYDMWATTGVGGWPFPQSFQVQGWAARFGAVVVILGFLLLLLRPSLGGLPERVRFVVARMAILAGALATAFLATWSLQPAFWQGVGPHGPATLADFPLITQSQPGKLTGKEGNATITFASSQVLAAQESSVRPALRLTITAHPFFTHTTANTAAFNHNAVQTVTITGWVRDKAQVRSLWVSALFGRSSWDSPTQSLHGVPALKIRGQAVSPREATWVAPGWAVVSYSVQASMVSRRGQLKVGLESDSTDDAELAWNGSPHVRWVIASLRSGVASAAVDNATWHGLVTLPSPTPSLWIQRVEEASFDVAIKPRGSVKIDGVSIGGQRASLLGGSFTWPSSSGVDHTIHAPLLVVVGVLDAIVLIGGGLILGRWVARPYNLRVRAALGRAAQ